MKTQHKRSILNGFLILYIFVTFPVLIFTTGYVFLYRIINKKIDLYDEQLKEGLEYVTQE